MNLIIIDCCMKSIIICWDYKIVKDFLNIVQVQIVFYSFVIPVNIFWLLSTEIAITWF